MSKTKENQEKIHEDFDEIPFGGNEPDVLIMFKCRSCGYEENVPDFVALESYIPGEFAENGSPIVLCPHCEGDMIIKSDED